MMARKEEPWVNDETRWEAVIRRDRNADGAFYYAVQTTGVYCRPSCAARLPRREHVRFYTTGGEAVQAGFRPCKRCKPQDMMLASSQAIAVAAACRQIEAAEEMPTLETLAQQAGMSRYHFHRVFKSFTGVTPRAYAEAQRSRRVREELARSATVTTAIYEAGFHSNGRFYATATERLGMTPTAFRSGGHGEVIRFAVEPCWLGNILVAATDKGVCAILFGDTAEALVHDLQQRFPNARFLEKDADFAQRVAQVIHFVEAPALGLDLPLDVRGTAFQQRVWQALQQIPCGSTASYADIAQRLGAPKAVRAVAQACAANAIAVAIPCHRVVRHDGALSGYRWGVERKRALLAREAETGQA